MKYALPSALAMMLAACDAAVVAQPDATKTDGNLAVQATIDANDLDLESIHFLIKKGKVKDAAALEKKINDSKEKLNNVDTDGDGTVDKVQLVEIKMDGGGSDFEIKIVPSKSKDKDAAILIAVIHLDPDKTTNKLIVKAEFTPVVKNAQSFLFIHETDIVVKGDTFVVVEQNPFYSWFFVVNRPVFVGVVVFDAPAVVIERRHWRRHKGKGKWKGK